jgi:Asp/Glu/hydantoin racemase
MKVYLLHSVRPGLNHFGSLLKKSYPHTDVRNMLDDFLILESNESKGFSKRLKFHLLQLLSLMQDAGADLIVCTCSSLTPILGEMRQLIEIPIIAIDDTMAEKVLEYGEKILVFGTADTAINSAVKQIKTQAERNGIICKVDTLCLDDAGQIMRNGGDMKKHDKIILDNFENIKKYDVIVLAQLSTSHLAEKLYHITQIPILTTPMLCIDNLANYIIE